MLESLLLKKGHRNDDSFCREEVTRTPDPYVPNVVRYQLRYFSLTFVRFDYLLAQIFSSFSRKRVQKYCFFLNCANFSAIILHFFA